MLVKDLELAQKYRRIPATATAAEAIALMAEYHIPVILVEKGSEGDTYGVLTRRDMISKVIAEGLDPTKVTVTELASKPLMVLNNNEVDVIWVARFMARENVSTLALFDGGEFKGFVTDADVLRALAAPLRAEFGHHGGHRR
ncbi:MAG: CBS domain-containing protein [Euryarchaeota archaeon]|nr:CBS domain-containing protein [Euryarchaeota archaeon]